MFPREASKRLCVGCCLPRPSEAKAGLSRRILLSLQRERASAFTLLELLIVVGIIAILLVLIAPAFTTIKSATDVTSASYTIKSALDTARTYAKTNNTYTWVGFYEEDVSQPSIVHGSDPCTGCVGRLVVSVAASQDGTTVYDPNNLAKIDTTKLIQVGKLTKIENCTSHDIYGRIGYRFDVRYSASSHICYRQNWRYHSSESFSYPFSISYRKSGTSRTVYIS